MARPSSNGTVASRCVFGTPTGRRPSPATWWWKPSPVSCRKVSSPPWRVAPSAPLWLNLEYLSAEEWIEGCHALPSLQPTGLNKYFFFPGFTAKVGGAAA